MNKTERQQLISKAYDNAYNRFLRTSHIDPMGEAFSDGWNAALTFVGSLLETPGGDGCFCTHHPDDPAHTEDCYSVLATLIDERINNGR